MPFHRVLCGLALVAAATAAAAEPDLLTVPEMEHEIAAQHGGTHMHADYVDHPYAAPPQANAPGTPEGRRLLASGAYRPFRIVTYIVDAKNKGVRAEDLEYLRTAVLPAAVRYWHRALSVVPVAGNLKASRFCTSSYAGEHSDKCANYAASETCLDVTIPTAHLAPAVKHSWSGGWQTTTVPGGAGVPDADFVLYAFADDNAACTTAGGDSTGTLAYASACQRDQYDRPTFGMANWCPQKIQREAASWEDQLATAIHEIGHALGMAASHFPLMRDASAGGAPRTARGADGLPAEVYADCPDGIKRWRLNVSASTVQIAPLTPGATGAPLTASHHVARLVTPRVQAEARAHFGCASLAGAELENWVGINGNICSGPDKSCGQLATSGACAGQSGCSWILSACLGSHWDERLFKNNMMSPNSNLATFTPRVLLAFFEDTG